MPKLVPRKRWLEMSQQELLKAGILRMQLFCQTNGLAVPKVTYETDWHFSACAYYRPTYIKINLELCGTPAKPEQVRNWSWPGSTVDREPYGVICHELGHHADWSRSNQKHSYSGDYGESVCRASGERPLTGYCPNSAEWFAEMFRLFVTNHDLLRLVRPKTHDILCRDWVPVSDPNWRIELGEGVPARIVKSQENKFYKGSYHVSTR